eukprot:m.74284 g.74284  ORF g.74284 m.74284 type:complete len:172 (-) comp24645_c0_seq1:99-614(-)
MAGIFSSSHAASLLMVVLTLMGSRCVYGTNSFGEKFLGANANREGVVVLPSGLQYKVLTKGSGTSHPRVSTPCLCHYEGRTAQEYAKSGDPFDSSYARGTPITFAPNQVIGGWTEAMQLMVEGDKWRLFIPSELGYGDRGAGAKIGPGDALIFTIEMISIKGASVPVADDL